MNKHMLNEAIDGVFRSAKSETERKAKALSKKQSTNKQLNGKSSHRSSFETTN